MYLRSGQKAEKNPTISTVFKLVTSAFESLSSSDPYYSLDSFESFCAILKSQMVVICEYLVTFQAKLFGKKERYTELFKDWG